MTSSSLPDTVAWVDPGLSSGLAAWQPATRWYGAWDLPFTLLGDALELWAPGPGTWIGYERFTVTEATIKLTRMHPNADEVIGMVTHIARRKGWRMLPAHSPTERKAAAPDMLKRIGMHPGPSHRRGHEDDALSASRHLAVYLLKSGLMPADLAAKV